MSRHAKLSPSSAHRWLSCTASPSLEAGYPSTTSSYAEEGTHAHKLAELCTRYAIQQVSEADYLNELEELKTSEYYTEDMLDHCEEYAQYISATYQRILETCPDAFVDLEVRLDLTDFLPGGFGTADCVIVAEPNLYVIDFKYGKGVKVEVDGNKQMQIYALGALAKYGSLYDIKTLSMAIVQPRLGGISEAEVSANSLEAWAELSLKPKAKEAYTGPGVFKPSESACKFCKAAKDCKARAKYYADLFDDNEETGTLTPDEAGELLKKASGMENWLADLKAKVQESLYAGQEVTGWKLVAGRSIRKWSDEAEAEKILTTNGLTEEQIYKKKLIGIPDAEKLLAKKRASEVLADVVIKPEGAPTLAP